MISGVPLAGTLALSGRLDPYDGPGALLVIAVDGNETAGYSTRTRSEPAASSLSSALDVGHRLGASRLD